MAVITFQNHVIGRVDNPWLTTTDIDVAGRDADTLRAVAAHAVLDAPPCPTRLSVGIGAARRWIAFTHDGQSFQARFHPADHAIEVRLK